jgi:putative transposase
VAALRRNHRLASIGMPGCFASERAPAFVRAPAPEGDGAAERFVRTLKENLLCARTFETIEGLRRALPTFRDTYNTTWLIERHGFLTPDQFRQRQLQQVAEAA